ncbi:MAG: hypothetical protein ACHQ50_17425 [Fimbriimonadales bacterium]
MKPKNPTNRRGRKGPVARNRQSGEEGQTVIIDFIQHQIEAYNKELGGGVTVLKDQDGYTLIREDTGAPMALLRPDAKNGSFEVLCWSKSRRRWQPVGEWGTSMRSLNEALDFIATDSDDCFWT